MQPWVVPHLAEVFIFVDIRQITVALLLGLLQALEATVHIATLGIDLRQHVGIASALLWARDLGCDAHLRFVVQRIRIQLHGPSVFRNGLLQLLLAKPGSTQVYVKRSTGFIQCNGLLEVLGRRTVILLHIGDGSNIVDRIREFGVPLDRSLETYAGSAQIIILQLGHAQLVVECRVFAILF